ncbi:hypothetical protein [Nocardia sp. NPDC058114]|uniref:hypothetical protein n=1 Tax=Nocardia sp. NPDC058114 TaxID=3346346 RepID=UPI0036DA9424
MLVFFAIRPISSILPQAMVAAHSWATGAELAHELHRHQCLLSGIIGVVRQAEKPRAVHVQLRVRRAEEPIELGSTECRIAHILQLIDHGTAPGHR